MPTLLEIVERRRTEVGYADYLGALQAYRIDYPHEMHLLPSRGYLIDIPFANRLFPIPLDAINTCSVGGQAVLLTDRRCSVSTAQSATVGLA